MAKETATSNVPKILLWTGGFLLLMVSMGIYNGRRAESMKQELSEANRLWDAGDKPQAVERYKPLLATTLKVIPDDQRKDVFCRVIEREAELGNKSEVKLLIEKALKENLAIILLHPTATEIMKTVQAERASTVDSLSWNNRKVSNRVPVFENIVKKLKEKPDRLASEKQEEKFRSELQKLIDEFRKIPFDGSSQTTDAKTIIDLWETEIENKYQGHQYNLLKDEVASIFQQYRRRPE